MIMEEDSKMLDEETEGDDAYMLYSDEDRHDDDDDLNDEFEQMEMHDEADTLNGRDDSIACFTQHEGPVFCVSVDCSSALAVCGGQDDRAYVWRISDQKVMFECKGHSESVTCAGFSHDGKYVCTGDMNGLVQVWLTANSQLVWSFEVSSLEWLLWHRGAHVLVVGTSEGLGWVWRIPSGECKTLTGPGCRNTCGTMMADGKRLCCGYEDGSVRMWDLKTSSVIASYAPQPGHVSPVTCIACSPDGVLVLSGHENGSTALLGEALKLLGMLTTPPNQNESEVTSGAATGGPASSDETSESMSTKAEDMSVEAVDFVHGHQIATSVSLNGMLCVWDLPTHKLRLSCQHPAGVMKVVMSPSSPVAYTGCLDGVVRAWNVLSGVCLSEWHGHEEEILDLVLSDKNCILSASDDHTVRVFGVNIS